MDDSLKLCVCLYILIKLCVGNEVVGSVMCYDCLFTSSIDGDTEVARSGNPNCQDLYYAEGIATVSCQGQCFKKYKFLGEDEFSYERGCSTDCKSTEGDTSTGSASNYCCDTDFCNKAEDLQPYIVTFLLPALALIINI